PSSSFLVSSQRWQPNKRRQLSDSSTSHHVLMASSKKRSVNAVPMCRAAITFVSQDNIAFAMPFTACVGSQAPWLGQSKPPARHPDGLRAAALDLHVKQPTRCRRPSWPFEERR